MKRLIPLLTMLCAAGLPLTASALDYGTRQRFLAAETSAPSLPGARGEANPFADTGSRRARADDEDAQPSSASEPESRPATSRAANTRRAPAPGATPGPVAPPSQGHSALSWQSLLPGSIQ